MLYLDFGREYGQWKPNIYGTNENLEAVEFLKHLNSILDKKLPGTLTIAQEDGLWSELTGSVEDDNIGFDYKWNNNWAGDFLAYLSKDPIERKYVHDQLTLSMIYAYCEHYVLPLGSREAGNLAEFMEKLPGALKPGGRVAILTFHSGEDRLVKKALKDGYKSGIYTDYAKDVIRPSAQECAQNGRARSTKMRWAIRSDMKL